ncbi:hypothetical protein LUZ63_015336 [Rhynchospora breviuscula]|uniref:Uncharacterized protein n=1 Tax=Rhynchospora breviuscula TaxID=2022672 RepID=A0A9Q0HLZ9_9POAL|nr:hypothetical protein LUZ63_015336 [Rhynchospora breviuscula]
MGASPSLVMYRILFAALGCFMVATLIYTTVTDGSPFRPELLTPWMTATLIDFYVNVAALSVWVAYKESSWVSSVIWIVLLVCFGSAATCAYIVTKLFEISIHDPDQDPIDLLLVRSGQVVNVKRSYVSYGKYIFTILGAFMVAVVTYTVVTDGLPFRKELLTPWMAATLIDFYINVFAISLWIAHKETTWISACIWIIFLICLGSITTCTYIVVQLSRLSSQDPVYHVLLNSSSRMGAIAPTNCRKI